MVGFPVIENEKFRMRDVRISDVNDLFEYYGNSDFMRHTSTYHHNSLDETEALVHKLSSSLPSGKGIAWVIEEKQSHKAIGNIGLHFISDGKASVGFNVAKRYQNHGIATWALKNCLDYAFQIFKMKEIEATCKMINYASQKVMQKCDMKLSDIRHNSSDRNGNLYDTFVYKIFDSRRRDINEEYDGLL